MTPRLQACLGVALLAALVIASLAYRALGTGPGVTCPFGQDVLFPDQTVCDRTFGGVWQSVAIGMAAGGISAALALALAAVARTFRGVVDAAVAKSADVVFSLPDVLVLMLIGFMLQTVRDTRGFRPDAVAAMIASLVAIGWAGPTRMLQNHLRSLERRDFVTAAVALGAPRARIVARHLVPFAAEYVLAIFLLRVPVAILTESTVSFLGFGLPHDQPSLGTYLGQSYLALLRGEWRIVVPAWIVLVMIVLGFQWTGSAVMAWAARRSR